MPAERALEITGDEKAFDAGPPAPLTLAILRAVRVALPHRNRSVTVRCCWWWRTRHRPLADSALRAELGPVGAVAWGGNAFTSSVLSLVDGPPAAIRYWRPDAAGLRRGRRRWPSRTGCRRCARRPACTGAARARPPCTGPRRVDQFDVDWFPTRGCAAGAGAVRRCHRSRRRPSGAGCSRRTGVGVPARPRLTPTRAGRHGSLGHTRRSGRIAG
ncbi:hypothetical protein HBB16_18275 [Pseudonocardia sp. MCCB 268]|nr:hypothetical protein [Pseudonocardia cytotoxica]